MPLEHFLIVLLIQGVHDEQDGVVLLGQVVKPFCGQGGALGDGGVVDEGDHQGGALHEDEGTGEEEEHRAHLLLFPDQHGDEGHQDANHPDEGVHHAVAGVGAPVHGVAVEEAVVFVHEAALDVGAQQAAEHQRHVEVMELAPQEGADEGGEEEEETCHHSDAADDVLEMEPDLLIVVEEQIQGAEQAEGKGQRCGDHGGKDQPFLPAAAWLLGFGGGFCFHIEKYSFLSGRR